MNISTVQHTSALITSCDEIASYQFEDHLFLMTEIQLRRIVDRLSLNDSNEEQATDGDEVMVKNGQIISKFSRDAMHIESVHDKKYWKVLKR